MKKIWSIIIVGFLVIGGFGADAFYQQTYQENKTIHFSQLTIQEENSYASIQLTGADSEFMKFPYYIIPTGIETFTFPIGTKIEHISCMPKHVHTERISKELPIAPEPQMLSEKHLPKVGNTDVSPLSIQEWYTFDIGRGIVDNQRQLIVKVQLFPIQYQPSKQTITWAEEMDIEIHYCKTNEPMASSNEYEFLVISPDLYCDELETLVAHKNNRGLQTIGVSLFDIYESQYFPVEGRDNPEKIKYFIKNAIEDWGITYVLLVGDDELLPIRIAKPYNSFISDLYYADIYDEYGVFCSWDTNKDNRFGEFEEDKVDLFPDIYLGRLACVTEEEVNTCVQKIIRYEKIKGYSQEWFKKLVVIAGDCFPHDGISEGESATQIAINTMNSFVPDKIWASNGRLSGTNPTGVDEINYALNSGCGFFYYSGHSSSTKFFTFPRNNSNKHLPTPTGYYSNNHIGDLLNGERLPIVVFDSCSPCKFTDDQCLGWSFLSNQKGGGIGFFGATTYSLCNKGKEFTEGFAIKLALNVFDAYQNTDSKMLGDLWNNAIVDYIFPNMTIGDYITLEQWEPFIDPTLMINDYSSAPFKPQKPSGPYDGKIECEYCYSSRTIDPDGDDIYYLFDLGDETNSGWIGPLNSGQKCNVSHNWSARGNYEIRVKAKDVNEVVSDWSDPLIVSMPKNIIKENYGVFRFVDWFINFLMKINHV